MKLRVPPHDTHPRHRRDTRGSPRYSRRMADDDDKPAPVPFPDQLRAQLKTYVEARDRAELIAKSYPNKDIGREMADFRKALDGAIAGVEQALKVERPDT